jgi:hypothetical protein
MIKAFTPCRTNQTLHICVLPGRPQRSWSIPDSQRAQASPHDVAVDGVSIAHQISWRCVPRERLGRLPSNPLGRWMRRYGVVNELPPAMSENHQTVKQLEADRRHDEQICGGNSRRLVAQEGRPTLTRSWSWTSTMAASVGPSRRRDERT